MWRPTTEYPRDKDGWGPEALVLMPTAYGPVRLIAHLEAGMWLARAADDPVAWSELEKEPSHWCEAPEIIRDIHSDPGMLLATSL
jgi:hypothetical protein